MTAHAAEFFALDKVNRLKVIRTLSFGVWFQNEALNTILADLTARLTPEESRQLADILIKMLPDEFTAPHR